MYLASGLDFHRWFPFVFAFFFYHGVLLFFLGISLFRSLNLTATSIFVLEEKTSTTGPTVVKIGAI